MPEDDAFMRSHGGFLRRLRRLMRALPSKRLRRHHHLVAHEELKGKRDLEEVYIVSLDTSRVPV